MAIEWEQEPEDLQTEDAVEQFIKTRNILLPEQYLSLHRKYISPAPKMDMCFKFFSCEICEEEEYSVSCFFNLLDNGVDISLEGYLDDPPEMFIEGLVIFAPALGGGDKLCFDMRKPCDPEEIPIVVWHCHQEPENSISFVAPSFNAFMDMLYPDPDVE